MPEQAELLIKTGQRGLLTTSYKRLKKRLIVGEGNGNPLQYSCLEKSMDREAWWAIVHGVTKRHKGACMTHHHKGIVQSAFPALKILCALLPLPNPLASTDLLMVSIVVLLIYFNK